MVSDRLVFDLGYDAAGKRRQKVVRFKGNQKDADRKMRELKRMSLLTRHPKRFSGNLRRRIGTPDGTGRKRIMTKVTKSCDQSVTKTANSTDMAP